MTCTYELIVMRILKISIKVRKYAMLQRHFQLPVLRSTEDEELEITCNVRLEA